MTGLRGERYSTAGQWSSENTYMLEFAVFWAVHGVPQRLLIIHDRNKYKNGSMKHGELPKHDTQNKQMLLEDVSMDLLDHVVGLPQSNLRKCNIC